MPQHFTKCHNILQNATTFYKIVFGMCPKWCKKTMNFSPAKIWFWPVREISSAKNKFRQRNFSCLAEKFSPAKTEFRRRKSNFAGENGIFSVKYISPAKNIFRQRKINFAGKKKIRRADGMGNKINFSPAKFNFSSAKKNSPAKKKFAEQMAWAYAYHKTLFLQTSAKKFKIQKCDLRY